MTPDAWRRGGHDLTIRGHRIFYKREGEGTPLLLIHGFPTSSYDYYKLWPELTERFDVIAADMLGFGFSDKPRGHAYSIAEQADLLVALLRGLRIERCHVLCHDYGDTVGQELLARHAEGDIPYLLSMALLNGGLFPEAHRPRRIQKLLASRLGPLIARLSTRSQLARTMRSISGPLTPPSDADLDALWHLMSRDHGRAAVPALIRYMAERRVHRERWVGALLETTVPVRVINGVFDPISGEHMLQRYLALKPDVDIVRLQVGHYPQLEAPADVLHAYIPFVERVAAGWGNS